MLKYNNHKNLKKSRINCYISYIIILLLIIQIGTISVNACHTVGTYEYDYITTKTTYVQGEIVYGKETYTSTETLRLRIKDPEDTVIFESDPIFGTIITCEYELAQDAILGEWNIQVGRFYDGNWHWLTGVGDISYFSVITQRPFTLIVTESGNGSVQINPNEQSYIADTPVELKANAEEGWSFDHWVGDLSGNENPTTIIMNNNKTIQAHFIKNPFTLTILIEGEGNVAKDIYQTTFLNGTLVTLTAAASSGWKFSEWTGDLEGTSHIEIINITKNSTLTAHFIKKTDSGNSNGGNQGSSNPKTTSTNTDEPEPKQENIPPISKITLSDSNKYKLDLTIKFHGILSYDPDGNITNWLWNFGDDIGLSGATVTHQYSKPGTYIVHLTVIDDDEATNETEITIEIQESNNPPTIPKIDGPTEGIQYQSYVFKVNSSDIDGDDLIYAINWDDESKNISEWLSTDTEYILTKQWDTPGIYEVIVTVSDNKIISTSTFTIQIHESENAVNAISLIIIIITGFLLSTFIVIIKRNKVKEILGFLK